MFRSDIVIFVARHCGNTVGDRDHHGNNNNKITTHSANYHTCKVMMQIMIVRALLIIHIFSFGESLVDGLLNEVRNNHACICNYMCF